MALQLTEDEKKYATITCDSEKKFAGFNMDPVNVFASNTAIMVATHNRMTSR